jgi:DNA-binding protein H-NS
MSQIHLRKKAAVCNQFSNFHICLINSLNKACYTDSKFAIFYNLIANKLDEFTCEERVQIPIDYLPLYFNENNNYKNNNFNYKMIINEKKLRSKTNHSNSNFNDNKRASFGDDDLNCNNRNKQSSSHNQRRLKSTYPMRKCNFMKTKKYSYLLNKNDQLNETKWYHHHQQNQNIIKNETLNFIDNSFLTFKINNYLHYNYQIEIVLKINGNCEPSRFVYNMTFNITTTDKYYERYRKIYEKIDKSKVGHDDYSDEDDNDDDGDDNNNDNYSDDWENQYEDDNLDEISKYNAGKVMVNSDSNFEILAPIYKKMNEIKHLKYKNENKKQQKQQQQQQQQQQQHRMTNHNEIDIDYLSTMNTSMITLLIRVLPLNSYFLVISNKTEGTFTIIGEFPADISDLNNNNNSHNNNNESLCENHIQNDVGKNFKYLITKEQCHLYNIGRRKWFQLDDRLQNLLYRYCHFKVIVNRNSHFRRAFNFKVLFKITL